MKIFFKKFFMNMLYLILINVFLFFCHFWALCGVAFNDTSVHYNTVIEAVPIILFGIAPVTIGSIIFLFIFRKRKDFVIYQFIFFQLLVILGWIIFYIVNYVPNSKINDYIESISHSHEMDKQDSLNKKVLSELNDDYLVVDSLQDENQSVVFYFNEATGKLIMELEINKEKNYNIIDSIKKQSDVKEKISKYNSDFSFRFDEYDNLSICINDNCYYTYSNCEINENIHDCTKVSSYSMYYSDGKFYNPIFVYQTMVEETIKDDKAIYYFDDDRMLNIELNEFGIKIADDSIQFLKNDQRYSWVIVKNGEIILERSFLNYDLVFERDLIKPSFYDDIGEYEAYMKTFSDKFGYIKISNSVYWTNGDE